MQSESISSSSSGGHGNITALQKVICTTFHMYVQQTIGSHFPPWLFYTHHENFLGHQ